MNIKELTRMVEESTGRKVNWELGKKYMAFDQETGEFLAEYNPRNGKLTIK